MHKEFGFQKYTDCGTWVETAQDQVPFPFFSFCVSNAEISDSINTVN